MMISQALKERFCRDMQLPIKIFQEPYFSERLELYDKHFGCLEAYERFCEIVQSFEDEQSFFEAYNQTKENAIQYLQNNSTFMYFSQEEDMTKFDIPNRSFPKNSIYKENFVGKFFVSIDMCKGNFTALRHYNPDIFGGKETYEDFISMFTDNEHFIKSKYIRQVIFGAINPKRQVKYEQFLMNKVLDHLLQFFAPEKVVYFSTDEIVIEVDEFNKFLNSSAHFAINETVEKFTEEGIRIRAEVFRLDFMKEYETYIKSVFIKTFTSDGEALKNSELRVIKNATNMTMPYVIRKMYDLPPSDNDNVFLYEGRLAKFI